MKRGILLQLLGLISAFANAQNCLNNSPPKYIVIEKKISQAQFNIKNEGNKTLIDTSAKISIIKGIMKVHLENGKTVSFINNKGIPYDENRLDYEYIGFIKPINKYLIKQKGYEEIFYLLIDKINGKKDTLQGMPYFSPNNKFIFCKQYNPYETYDDIAPPTQDIQLLYYENNSLKCFFYKPFKWFIKDFFWKDDKTVFIKAINTKKNNLTQYIYIGLFIERNSLK